MKRAIEVKFCVLYDEVMTEKLKAEIMRKINENYSEIKDRLAEVSKIIDYDSDLKDVMESFIMIFEKRLITDVVSDTFNSPNTFEETALLLIEPTLKECIKGKELIEAICVSIETEISQRRNAYNKLRMEEMLNVLKIYF